MNDEISMVAIGAACDAIQDSARSLNLRAYAESIAKQLELERAQRLGNQQLQQSYYNQLCAQQSLGLQNQLGRGGNWQ